jgi:ABC-type proline/glycine betaine transport system ATPase subunit
MGSFVSPYHGYLSFQSQLQTTYDMDRNREGRRKLSDEEVYKLLRLADLDPSFFNKIGGELSVGQAQRVS